MRIHLSANIAELTNSLSYALNQQLVEFDGFTSLGPSLAEDLRRGIGVFQKVEDDLVARTIDSRIAPPLWELFFEPLRGILQNEENDAEVILVGLSVASVSVVERGSEEPRINVPQCINESPEEPWVSRTVPMPTRRGTYLRVVLSARLASGWDVRSSSVDGMRNCRTVDLMLGFYLKVGLTAQLNCDPLLNLVTAWLTPVQYRGEILVFLPAPQRTQSGELVELALFPSFAASLARPLAGTLNELASNSLDVRELLGELERTVGWREGSFESEVGFYPLITNVGLRVSSPHASDEDLQRGSGSVRQRSELDPILRG